MPASVVTVMNSSRALKYLNFYARYMHHTLKITSCYFALLNSIIIGYTRVFHIIPKYSPATHIKMQFVKCMTYDALCLHVRWTLEIWASKVLESIKLNNDKSIARNQTTSLCAVHNRVAQFRRPVRLYRRTGTSWQSSY